MRIETSTAIARNDWWVICPCQNHRVSRIGNLAETLKRSAGALVLMLPLAFGAFGLPLETATENYAQRKTGEKVLAGEEPALFTAAAQQQLQLITPSIREEFLMPRERAHTLDVERFRENFFRARVPYGDIIYREAKRYGIQPELVAAVIDTESNFRPTLVSTKNAQGLMQIIPATGRLMGANNLFNPADNIRAGTRYLRYLNRRFPGDSQLVLAAYNAGEGAIGRFGGIPPYRETQQYVRKVASRRSEYQRKVDRAVAAYVRLHTRAQVIQ